MLYSSPLAEIVLNGRHWLGWAIALCVVGVAAIVWAYVQANYATWVRVIAGVLKATGLLLLAALLVEPMFSGTRPKPGQAGSRGESAARADAKSGTASFGRGSC